MSNFLSIYLATRWRCESYFHTEKSHLKTTKIYTFLNIKNAEKRYKHMHVPLHVSDPSIEIWKQASQVACWVFLADPRPVGVTADSEQTPAPPQVGAVRVIGVPIDRQPLQRGELKFQQLQTF